ncbi:hypothetical protein LWI29_022642 [Acer saccharum]|uniref:Uncharacterized protein n=1 Tax=Acer saccharum TaxID=4024 RepID=A0AA39SWU7_ACESA|nr:hypothetical protein LWI29_022642 [Acer saccharum]
MLKISEVASISVSESNVKVELSESARDGVKASSDYLTGSGRQGQHEQWNRPLVLISNSSLVVMGIFDFTKVLSAQIPFTSYGFNAPTNNKMLYTRWMNDVASGNVTSLGVSSQSNAAAGEDSNEVEDVGLL